MNRLNLLLILLLFLFPIHSMGASADNNVEWNGLYHSWNNEGDGIVPGVSFRYREPYNNTSPGTIYDDQEVILSVQCYQGDLTDVWVRWWDGSEHWTQGYWNHNFNPGGGDRDYWRVNLGKLASGSGVWYQIQVKDGIDDDYVVDIASPVWSNPDGQDVDEDMSGDGRLEYNFYVSDDDTSGPDITNILPQKIESGSTFYITCNISDPLTDSGDNDSGVFDDNTGSSGQGIYLLWDDDGELDIDSNEVQMSLVSGATYITDSFLPAAATASNIVFKIHARNNDYDRNDSSDRDLTVTSIQGITVYTRLDSTANSQILFPTWSHDGKNIAYIKVIEEELSIEIYIVPSDLSEQPRIITDAAADRVFNCSKISFSPDDTKIVYTQLLFGDLDIYAVSSDPNDSLRGLPFFPDWSIPDYGRTVDPDYGTSVNQFASMERVALSISGDIWVYEPDSSHPYKNPVQLTNLSDWLLDNSQVDKLLMPAWAPDNKSIAFVRRPPTESSLVADADIWVLNEVQDIIESSLTGGTILPPSSWSDTRLVKISDSTNPDWFPSFSIDSSLISFNTDINNAFNNEDFIFYPSTSLIPANFDIYISSSDGAGVNTLVEGNSFNEAFIQWAPAGGDLFTYVSIDEIGNCTLDIISYPTSKQIGGFRNKSSEPLIIKDHSFSSLIFPNGYQSQDLDRINFYTPKPGAVQTSKLLRPINSFRIIELASGQTKLNEKAILSIHYTPAQIRNISEDSLILMRFHPKRKEWIPLNSTLNRKTGTVSAEITLTGIYGIFSDKKAPNLNFIDEWKFFAFPNPVR
ncbi:MAG: hypothetical protein PHV06_06005, partial [bacterium]|nr:hypothetical protein [bacterium]